MDLNTKQEILEVLTMPEETFWSQVAPAAREVCQKTIWHFPAGHCHAGLHKHL